VSSWVVLEPLSVDVEAGGEADVTLRVRNTSDIVEEYHIDIVGAPGHWCTAEPSVLRLYPGTTGEVRLTFAPPRGPDPAAGPHSYAVRVSPKEAPDDVTVPEGTVSVAPFADVRADLLPPTVRGWSRARPRLAVDNYGNTSLTASVTAGTRDNRMDFDIREPGFQVPPGRAHFGVLRLRPAGLLWLGRAVSHQFTVVVQPSGAAKSVNVNGTYLQTALLPPWLGRLATVLVGLAAAFAAVWFLLSPTASSQATRQAAGVQTPVAQTRPAPTQPAKTQAAKTQSQSPPAASTAPAAGGPSAATQTHQAVTLPAPAGWWKMNEGTGDVAQDSAGDQPATGVNTGWCSTKNCMTFNGTSSALTTSGPVLDTGPGHSFTVSAWVGMGSTVPSGLITAVSQDGNWNSGFYLEYSGSNNCWAFARVSSDVKGQTNVPYRALGCTGNYTAWTFLTGVFDSVGNQERIYVNGKLGDTTTDPSPFAADGPLAIGRGQGSDVGSNWWPDAIDNVEAFNTALTSPGPAAVFRKVVAPCTHPRTGPHPAIPGSGDGAELPNQPAEARRRRASAGQPASLKMAISG
jgi:hypothetical protein